MRIFEVVILLCLLFLQFASPQSEFQCVRNGRYPAVDVNCQRYYFCYWNGNGYQRMTLTCPGTSQFNPSLQFCVRPNTFTCNSGTSTSTTTVRTTTTTTRATTSTTRATTTTTRSVNATYECVRAGRFPQEDADCQWYFFCFWNGTGYTAWRLKCPNTTRFNPTRELCVAPDSYSCNAITSIAPTTEEPATTTVGMSTSPSSEEPATTETAIETTTL